MGGYVDPRFKLRVNGFYHHIGICLKYKQSGQMQDASGHFERARRVLNPTQVKAPINLLRSVGLQILDYCVTAASKLQPVE